MVRNKAALSAMRRYFSLPTISDRSPPNTPIKPGRAPITIKDAVAPQIPAPLKPRTPTTTLNTARVTHAGEV